MRARAADHAAYRGEQIGERRIVGRRESQRQGLHTVTEKLRLAFQHLPRHRHGHDDIALAGQAHDQRCEGGEGHGIAGDRTLGGNGGNAFGHRVRQAMSQGRTFGPAWHGASAQGWQAQRRRRSCIEFAPPGQIGSGIAGDECLYMVRKRHRGGQRRRSVFHLGSVESAQVAEKQHRRPAVADQVMQHHADVVAIVGHAMNRHLGKRCVRIGQIQYAFTHGADRGIGFVLGLRTIALIDPVQLHQPRTVGPILAFAVGRKTQGQGLVPRGGGLDGRSEGAMVERAPQPQATDLVIGRGHVRIHLLGQPDFTLGLDQGHRFAHRESRRLGGVVARPRVHRRTRAARQGTGLHHGVHTVENRSFDGGDVLVGMSDREETVLCGVAHIHTVCDQPGRQQHGQRLVRGRIEAEPRREVTNTKRYAACLHRRIDALGEPGGGGIQRALRGAGIAFDPVEYHVGGRHGQGMADMGTRKEGHRGFRDRIVVKAPAPAVDCVQPARAAGQRADGHAAAEDLAVGAHVRADLPAPVDTARGTAKAGNHLVENQRRA